MIKKATKKKKARKQKGPMLITSQQRDSLASLMQSYQAIRQGLKDKGYQKFVMAYRLGDFYEFFNEDAINAAIAIQKIAVTKRAGVRMLGIPAHASGKYFSLLLNAGYTVAVIESTSVPPLRKMVTEVYKPGDVLNGDVADPTEDVKDLVVEDGAVCRVLNTQGKLEGAIMPPSPSLIMQYTELYDRLDIQGHKNIVLAVLTGDFYECYNREALSACRAYMGIPVANAAAHFSAMLKEGHTVVVAITATSEHKALVTDIIKPDGMHGMPPHLIEAYNRKRAALGEPPIKILEAGQHDRLIQGIERILLQMSALAEEAFGKQYIDFHITPRGSYAVIEIDGALRSINLRKT